MKRYICLDTETTGADLSAGNRIIEIGCVEVIDYKKTGKTYPINGQPEYINPLRSIELGAMNVHGITDEMVKNAKQFYEISESFLEFINGAELVIHNAAFDISFLNMELKLANLPPLKNDVIDTLLLARKKFPGQQASLDALCRKFKIDNSARKYHGALLDADLLADVFILMNEEDKFQISTTNVQTTVERKKISFPKRQFPPSVEEIENHNKFLESILK